VNSIIEYWNQIEGGQVTVSSRVRRVYKKLVADTRKPSGVYWFDEDKARRPIEFIERFCKHSKGEWAGKPVQLELFQKAYISALFGFVHKVTGLRKYRETLFMVARKNGKSTILAGIALYMMIADGEQGAEVYSIATKKDQARIVFDETHNMVKQSSELSRHVKKRKNDLYFTAGMARFQPLGKNSDTFDGLNPNCVIIDELHGVKDRNLYEVMQQGQAARQQPLLIMITTAGTVRECIFDDIYGYACGVINGTVADDTFLPIIYELDARSEWNNPDMWEKANPGLGTVKKRDFLVSKVERAKVSPKDLSGVLCKDFNIKETSYSAWLTYDALNNTETFSLDRFRGCYAIGGADLSLTTDLTCATLLFLDKETDQRYITQMYWLPFDSFKTRVEQDKVPYDIWLDRGLLRLCDGNSISYSDITKWFLEMVAEHDITPAWIGYDSWSAKYWVEEMESHGFKMERVIQGAKTLSLPMQQLGADLELKKVIYNDNPILKWCLSNTGVHTDRNNNIVPVKNQSAKRRIDGTASLLNAYVILLNRYNEFKNAL
jgi:phage terminase large subunit-like protein